MLYETLSETGAGSQLHAVCGLPASVSSASLSRHNFQNVNISVKVKYAAGTVDTFLFTPDLTTAILCTIVFLKRS